MRNDYERRIIRVIDHIFDNPAGDLSLARLADVAAMSRHHWHRVFCAMTGETPAQAVRRIRLLRAAMMLVHEDAPVSAIAAGLGYPNAASFSRAFAVAYGVSPTAFRRAGVTGPGNPRFRAPAPLTREVVIRDLAPVRLAALPHEGDYNRIDRAFERLGSLVGARGLAGEVRGVVGVFHDDPARAEFAALRAHAGFAVGAAVEVAAPLEALLLPGGRHAVMRVTGPYSQFADAYDQLLGTWLPDSGEEAGEGPAYFVYRNNIAVTPQEALETDICLPLAPRSA